MLWHFDTPLKFLTSQTELTSGRNIGQNGFVQDNMVSNDNAMFNNAPSMNEMDIPETFICPVTLDVMVDPLISRYGHNYERRAILDWLKTGTIDCPLTKQPLRPSDLIPNEQLRVRIAAWRITHGCGYPEINCMSKTTGPSHTSLEGNNSFYGIMDLHWADVSSDGMHSPAPPAQSARHRRGRRQRLGMLSRLHRPFRLASSR